MIEMVIKGVSTRKIQKVTEELCGQSFSKSTVSALCKKLDPVIEAFCNHPFLKHDLFVIIDALYFKARESSKVALIVQGIREDVHREILGFEVSDRESKNQLECVLSKS
jgi:transposase-like protein